MKLLSGICCYANLIINFSARMSLSITIRRFFEEHILDQLENHHAKYQGFLPAESILKKCDYIAI